LLECYNRGFLAVFKCFCVGC